MKKLFVLLVLILFGGGYALVQTYGTAFNFWVTVFVVFVSLISVLLLIGVKAEDAKNPAPPPVAEKQAVPVPAVSSPAPGFNIRYQQRPYFDHDDYYEDDKRPGKGRGSVEWLPEYVVIDLETTGLNPAKDEIVELAAIRVRDGVAVDVFQSLVKPKIPIPASATQIHGITDDMVSDAPCLRDVLPVYLEFIGDDDVVGHNVVFDVNFLYDHNMRLFNEPFYNDYADTLRLSRLLYPHLRRKTLGDLVKYLGVKPSGSHRALSDCESVFCCFEIMQNERLQAESQQSKVLPPVKEMPQTPAPNPNAQMLSMLSEQKLSCGCVFFIVVGVLVSLFFYFFF